MIIPMIRTHRIHHLIPQPHLARFKWQRAAISGTLPILTTNPAFFQQFIAHFLLFYFKIEFDGWLY